MLAGNGTFNSSDSVNSQAAGLPGGGVDLPRGSYLRTCDRADVHIFLRAGKRRHRRQTWTAARPTSLDSQI
jgi:hypothetical protein